jgi:hypothetical protein
MRWLACIGILSMVLTASGCNLGPDERPLPSTVDPVKMVSALPVPAGFTEKALARTADAAVLSHTLFAEADQGMAAELSDRGLLRAGTRTFASQRGGTMEVAVAVWRNHESALASGSLTAQRAIDQGDAKVWEPSGLRGAQGSERSTADGTIRTLARAIDQNALFVRSSGSVTEAEAIRAMDRLTALANGVSPRR